MLQSFVLTTALLCQALTALAGQHGHAHKKLHARHPLEQDHWTAEEKLRKREIYARNKEAADNREATNWIQPGWEGADYSGECLKHHNYHRQNHKVIRPDSYTAQLVAESCVYGHNLRYDNGIAGQNIAAGIPANNVSGVITELWYNAEYPYFSGYYGVPQPDYTHFEQWAHMTQIVWYATTHVGCATQYCPVLANAGSVAGYFTVCNYKNPGNVAGEYAQNVFPRQGAPDIHWNQ
ncbi:Peptidase inhibitor 16 [Cercospora zeina]